MRQHEKVLERIRDIGWGNNIKYGVGGLEMKGFCKRFLENIKGIRQYRKGDK
ncbi:hypothetical protein EMIT07CA2_50254 [Brevibacillus sp. IT-7CA2]